MPTRTVCGRCSSTSWTEDLENVKTKFYKGSNSVRGSGIGLALVDSIMTALDGTMDIKSTLGRGTVVTLGLSLYHKA